MSKSNGTVDLNLTSTVDPVSSTSSVSNTTTTTDTINNTTTAAITTAVTTIITAPGVSVNKSLSSFEKFCGNSPFWDSDLLLHSSFPRFTPCFHQVAVSWIPCLFFIAACAPYLYYVFAKASVPVSRIGFVGTIKTICISCLVLITFINIIVRAADDQDGVPGALYVSEVLKLVSFILAVVITYAERSKGIVASPMLWTFWLFLFVLNLIPFYSYFEGDKQHMDRCDFILFLFYFFLVLLSLAIASLVEKREEVQDASSKDANECPMSKSSIPNRLLYFWMNRLVISGYKKTLVEDDVFELNTGEKLRRIAPRFQATWLKHKEKVDAFNATIRPPPSRINTRSSVRDEEATREIPLLPVVEVAGDGGEKSPYKKISVFKVLFANHGPQLISTLIVKAAFDCFALLTPKITEALLAYVADRKSYHEWYGYGLAVAYLVVGTITSIVSNQTILYAKRCGIRMKVALINAVYRKSLTAANIGDESSKGEINNLMSISTQKIQEISEYIHLIFSAPLQVIVALYLLYQQLGPAVFAGLSIFILTVPLNGLVGFFFERWQTEMMARKDERGSLLSQLLNGIKVLKLYAWEISFQKKAEHIRNQELKVILYMQYVMAAVSFIYQALPSLVQITAFGVYISMAGYLDPTVCFVSLQLFAMLNSPLMTLPLLIPSMIQTMVALDLISNYLNKSDIKTDSISKDSNAANAVEIRNGNFTWTPDQPVPTLRNINMEVAPGSLVAVVGTVGCGKSSLMSAILGEMDKLSGDVKLKGTTAYVPQEAWIQNATLRDNITFGKEHQAEDYDNVIEACALKSDLEILAGGDMTEIGEKGINISGGQKQRVSLARAVYSDRDVFLLDDPLSAVDSHVGKHIFEKVIGENGLLKNKTRVLVTHGIHWLPMVDKIFVLTQGEISETGKYSELLEKDGDFAQFIKEYAQETEKIEDTEDDEEDGSSDKKERKRKDSTRSDGSVVSKEKVAVELEEDKAGAKLVDDESGLSGSVKASTYLYFLKQFGLKSFCLAMLLFLLQAGCNIFSAIWLTIWTSDEYLLNRTNKDDSRYNDETHKYLAVYACASIISGLFIFVFFMIAAVKLTSASRVIHNNMLANVLRSPMLFFDTTPIGRILNRFTMDVDIMDMSVPMSLNQLLNVGSMVFVTIVNICYGTPIFLVALVPLTILYICVQALYIPTCRQLRRIESITRSPIYVQFSETLNGTDSIRAYACQERFIEESVKRVDHNHKFYFASVSARCWLTLWLNFLGNMVIFLAAIFAVAATNIEPSVVGLSVAYASTMTRALEDLVNGTSDTETNLVSVERMKEYTETEQEAPWSLEDHKPKPEWPENGQIVFDNYQTRYRPGLDLVLKDVSCTIKGGEKVGIVGRTGAGKSSMTVALFRIIEAAGGKIVIDGEDVSKMGLHDLRSKITILPQDPVIFSGSMRLNLDPFEMYKEQDLWNALEHSYLKEFVEGLPEKLEYDCGEEGSNLSVGQRQLVCLARTLLRKTKILVLDEATAAVDMETDDLIQKTIRKEFKDSTILTIAHRLNTIMDYDRVMVLDKGCIKEFDSPAVLLADDSTIFHGMAKEAGLV